MWKVLKNAITLKNFREFNSLDSKNVDLTEKMALFL